MTEAEWLTSTDSYTMLHSLAAGDPRKLRQFACECWRRIVPGEQAHAVVTVYQRYTDGEATPTEWFEAYSGSEWKSSLQDLIAPEPFRAACLMTGFARSLAGYFTHPAFGPVDRPAEAALLRDIFGNPFRAPAFAPQWRTDTAVALARSMCDAREFSAMPILADALQDAGCDDETLLSHCRDTALAHARNCWVIDLVLGKS